VDPLSAISETQRLSDTATKNLTGLGDPSGLSAPGRVANPIAATTVDDETTTANHADRWEMEG
jgi:hypothetical protein